MSGSNEDQTKYTGWPGAHTPPPLPNPYDLEKRISILELTSVNINKELEKINGNISKLVWIVLAGVVLAILNTVLT